MAISAAALLLTGNLACTSGSGQSLNTNSVLHIAVDEGPYWRLDASWKQADLDNFKAAFDVDGDTYTDILQNLRVKYPTATGDVWVQILSGTNSTTYNLANSPASGADMIPNTVYYTYTGSDKDALFIYTTATNLYREIIYTSTKDCQSKINTKISNSPVYNLTWVATATLDKTTTALVTPEAPAALAVLKGTGQIPTCFTKIIAE